MFSFTGKLHLLLLLLLLLWPGQVFVFHTCMSHSLQLPRDEPAYLIASTRISRVPSPGNFISQSHLSSPAIMVESVWLVIAVRHAFISS